jgi:hypothetical protein
MARAREALDEANLLLANAHVHTAVNRIYYACFYAVSALLLTEGQSSSRHSGVRALFDRLWIGPERLPREMGRFYRHLFDVRQRGDYTDLVTFDPAEARAWRDEAAVFVERIARTIDAPPANEPKGE